MQDDDQTYYEMAFDTRQLFQLKQLVDHNIQNWAGYPARPHEEQEFLYELRDAIRRMILEHTFYDLEADK